jgi:hypothetical protein
MRSVIIFTPCQVQLDRADEWGKCHERKGEKSNTNFVKKHQGRIQLRRHKRRYEDSIKTDLKETERKKNMPWMRLTHNMGQILTFCKGTKQIRVYSS